MWKSQKKKENQTNRFTEDQIKSRILRSDRTDYVLFFTTHKSCDFFCVQILENIELDTTHGGVRI